MKIIQTKKNIEKTSQKEKEEVKEVKKKKKTHEI